MGVGRAVPAASPRRIQSVDHAIDVLHALARLGRPTGVSDIARQIGLSKASAHHLLSTLESRGFVMRQSDSPLYKLGWALYELGSNVVRDVDLSRVARPYLDHLAVQTNESVLLGILDGDSVLYLDRGEGPSGLQMRANAGRRGPLHATASGKILLACSTDPTLLTDLLSRPLERLTRATITDPDTLRHDVAQARQQGYATCWQEGEVGLASVAVPLHDHRGVVIASLTVAGPASRLTTRTLQGHLLPLHTARRRIESHLGAPERPTIGSGSTPPLHSGVTPSRPQR
jgi:DNA-binding IclR family transcriptional regulator